jgi:hypothetical protein
MQRQQPHQTDRLAARTAEMKNTSQQDDFQRVLREIEEIVDDSVRLQEALDEARTEELTRRRFDDRRVAERRLGVERRAVDRRQRP